MSPWWIRNYQVAGQFVPTTLQVGASLYDGLNPQATGASDMRFTTEYHRVQKLDDAAAGRSSDGFEVRLDRRLRDDAWAWARTHPGESLGLGRAQVPAHVECVAECQRVPQLDVAHDRGSRIRTHAGAGRNRAMDVGAARLAVHDVSVPGRVLHVSACGVCQFDPIPRPGDVSVDRAGCRRCGSCGCTLGC